MEKLVLHVPKWQGELVFSEEVLIFLGVILLMIVGILFCFCGYKYFGTILFLGIAAVMCYGSFLLVEPLTSNSVIRMFLTVSITFLGMSLVYFCNMILGFILDKLRIRTVLAKNTYLVSAPLGAAILGLTIYYMIWRDEIVAGAVAGVSLIIGLIFQFFKRKNQVQFRTYNDLIKLPLPEDNKDASAYAAIGEESKSEPDAVQVEELTAEAAVAPAVGVGAVLAAEAATAPAAEAGAVPAAEADTTSTVEADAVPAAESAAMPAETEILIAELASALAAMSNTAAKPEKAPVVELTETEPEKEPVVELTEAKPEKAPVVELTEAEPEKAPVVELTEAEPEKAPVVELTEAEPEKAPVVELTETEPEKAPVVELTETEPEKAPVVELTEAEPEKVPVVELTEAEPEKAPVVELTEAEPEKAPEAELAKAIHKKAPVMEFIEKEVEALAIKLMEAEEHVSKSVPETASVKKSLEDMLSEKHISNAVKAKPKPNNESDRSKGADSEERKITIVDNQAITMKLDSKIVKGAAFVATGVGFFLAGRASKGGD